MRLITALAAATLLISPAAFAEESAPGPFKEPNMRLPKNSGGMTNSALILEAPLKTDFVMGKPDAPLLMVEYASMTCPHCAHFGASVLPVIQKNYIDTGKLRYILRQYPLNEPALKAAMLLQCIGEQSPEKYYVFTKVLFDAQSKWAFDSNYMAGLETISGVGGVSRDQFAACTGSTEREMAVLKAKKQASDELKIPHTPFLYVGNEAFDGERTPELVSQFIEKKLAELKAAKKPE